MVRSSPASDFVDALLSLKPFFSVYFDHMKTSIGDLPMGMAPGITLGVSIFLFPRELTLMFL